MEFVKSDNAAELVSCEFDAVIGPLSREDQFAYSEYVVVADISSPYLLKPPQRIQGENG